MWRHSDFLIAQSPRALSIQDDRPIHQLTDRSEDQRDGNDVVERANKQTGAVTGEYQHDRPEERLDALEGEVQFRTERESLDGEHDNRRDVEGE